MENEQIIGSLETAIADVLDDQCTIERVQHHARDGSDLATVLRQQAIDLGWVGISAPEHAGGSGLGIDALIPIYRQLGAYLAPLPFLGQQLAIQALSDCGAVADESLADLVAGSAWAIALPALDGSDARISADGSVELSDTLVIGDAEAKWALVTVDDDAGGEAVALHAIDSAMVEPVRPHDATRATFRLRGTRGPATWLARGIEGRRVADRLRAHAGLAIAADCVGGARAVLDRTVDYMKTREQFGRPIGSFQALKHRAASMKLKLEAAAALLRAATAAWGDADRGLALAMLAKARACDAYVEIAADAIQLHGGIGFTVESPVHLYLKRAKMNEALLGGDRRALDDAASLLVRVAA